MLDARGCGNCQQRRQDGERMKWVHQGEIQRETFLVFFLSKLRYYDRELVTEYKNQGHSKCYLYY